MKPPFLKDVSTSALREAARTFRPVISRQKRGIRVAILFTFVTTGLKLLQPWPLKFVLDRVIRNATPGPWGWSPRVTIGAAAVITIALALLQGGLSLLLTKRSAEVARDLAVGIRRQVFEHLHRLELPFHTSGRTGELLMRLTGDVDIVRDGLFTQWLRALGSVMTFVIMVGIMFWLDPLLAAVAFIPLPVVLFVMPRMARRLRQATRRQRKRQGSAAALAAESLRHIRVVKAYTAEDRATEEFSRESRAGETAGVRAARISAEMERNTDILTGVGLALVLLFGAQRVVSHAITIGDLVVFLSYARSFYRPIGNVSDTAVRMGRVSAAAERMLEVLHMTPEDPSEGRPAPRFSGGVAFDRVSFAYPQGSQALRDVSFTVPPGSLAMLVGPNGSGKSTILSILLRLIRPDDGKVRIDGDPISEFQVNSYRSRFAYVPQEIQLFSGTLKENILYGRLEGSDEEVEDAAHKALLDDVVGRLPDGLDATLGEGGETLSGGEARRLMLARAAIRDARVLILDEPLTGLDPEATGTVAAALRQVSAGRTTIVVSHEAVSEFNPDLVIHLDAGRVTDVTHPQGAQAPPVSEREEITAG